MPERSTWARTSTCQERKGILEAPTIGSALMDKRRKNWELCLQPPPGKKDLKFCFVLFLPTKPPVSYKTITQEHLLAETKTQIAQEKYHLPPPPSWARAPWRSQHLHGETKEHHPSRECLSLPLPLSKLRQWGELFFSAWRRAVGEKNPSLTWPPSKRLASCLTALQRCHPPHSSHSLTWGRLCQCTVTPPNHKLIQNWIPSLHRANKSPSLIPWIWNREKEGSFSRGGQNWGRVNLESVENA